MYKVLEAMKFAKPFAAFLIRPLGDESASHKSSESDLKGFGVAANDGGDEKDVSYLQGAL